MTKDQIAQAWRTALDPAGEWVSRVLEAADKRLTEVRRGMPDAGGLVIAGDPRGRPGVRRAAGGRADRQAPGRGAVRRQDREQEDLRVRFVRRALDGRGADGVPRAWTSRASPSACTRPACPPRCSLPRRSAGSSAPGSAGDRVGVFAVKSPIPALGMPPSSRPNATTCYAPARARPVRKTSWRWPKRCASATPPDAPLDEPASPPSTRPRTSTGCCTTAASSAPPRRPARRRKRTSSACPACSTRTRSAPCFRKRQNSQLAARTRGIHVTALAPPAPLRPRWPFASIRRPPPKPPAAPPAKPPRPWPALRKELNGLVGAWSPSHRPQPHGRSSTTELRRTCGGPPLPQATADQIRARIDTIRRWAIPPAASLTPTRRCETRPDPDVKPARLAPATPFPTSDKSDKAPSSPNSVNGDSPTG